MFCWDFEQKNWGYFFFNDQVIYCSDANVRVGWASKYYLFAQIWLTNQFSLHFETIFPLSMLKLFFKGMRSLFALASNTQRSQAPQDWMLLSDVGECSAISFLMVDRRILSVCKCYFKSRGNSAVWRPQSSTNLHHGLAWRHVYHYYRQVPLYYASKTMTSAFARFSWAHWENAVPMIGVLTYFCVTLTRWNARDLHFDPEDTMLQRFNWSFFY